MANLKIITEGNPVLRRKATDVPDSMLGTDELHRLASNMTDTMISSSGVGLAAPQIGQSIRLVIVDTAEGPAALINPIITFRSNKKEKDTEGCLSCPGVEITVSRPKKIECRAQTVDGNSVKFPADGLLARVIQHEIDHLDGILIVDKQ